MRLKNHSQAWSAVAIAGILVALAMPASSSAETATPAGAAKVPLVTFRPGAPEEARWTVIDLVVPPEGATPTLAVTFDHARCPLTWGFLFLQGPPDDAKIVGGITFHFASGTGGYLVYTNESWPVQINESEMTYNGLDWCYGGPTWNIQLLPLPAGPIHLLHFTAGTPFSGRADLFLDAPVEVGGRSSGDGTHYISPDEFAGGVHVAVQSPPAFDGVCEPSCAWSGGEFGVADVAKDRSAALSFAHRPYFVMIDWAARATPTVAISRVTVTDPLGEVIEAGGLLPPVAGYRVKSWGIEVIGTDAFPPGQYEFAIDTNIDVSKSQVGWHVYAVDFEFPEEQQTRLTSVDVKE